MNVSKKKHTTLWQVFGLGLLFSAGRLLAQFMLQFTMWLLLWCGLTSPIRLFHSQQTFQRRKD
jgi:hypothetical protein